MRASKDELSLLIEAGSASVRGADWGDMRVAVVSVPAGTDFGPLLQGLPHNRCQCPHWGYVLKGKVSFVFPDHEERFEAGDAYYVPPGHVPMHYSGTEIVEFSPTDVLQETVKVVMSNLQRGGAA
jgi:mannose-6-phosphate isomerase-like protein (cupin superfamily)